MVRERIQAIRCFNGCVGDLRRPGATAPVPARWRRLDPTGAPVLRPVRPLPDWARRAHHDAALVRRPGGQHRRRGPRPGIIFTHDHYGPSTHQQIGLYATVLTEPAGSRWVHNETGVQLGARRGPNDRRRPRRRRPDLVAGGDSAADRAGGGQHGAVAHAGGVPRVLSRVLGLPARVRSRGVRRRRPGRPSARGHRARTCRRWRSTPATRSSTATSPMPSASPSTRRTAARSTRCSRTWWSSVQAASRRVPDASVPAGDQRRGPGRAGDQLPDGIGRLARVRSEPQGSGRQERHAGPGQRGDLAFALQSRTDRAIAT